MLCKLPRSLLRGRIRRQFGYCIVRRSGDIIKIPDFESTVFLI